MDNVNAIYFVDGGNVQGVGGHDARTVCPGQTTNYVLRITRRDNATVEFPITINVSGPPPQRPGPRIDRFWVSSTGVRRRMHPLRVARIDADGINLYLGGKNKVSGGPPEGSWQDCPSRAARTSISWKPTATATPSRKSPSTSKAAVAAEAATNNA